MAEYSDPILITGVGRRLGLLLARSYARQGMKVIGTYRTERPELDSLRQQGVDLHRCDFENEEDLQALIERLSTHYSRLRALVHNASLWLSESTDNDPARLLHRMMQVHVSAPYQLNLGLEPLLKNTGEELADIVHIGDYVSCRGSHKHIAYAASKAAQDNLTLSFASRLAPRVKVNSIAPALIMFNDGDSKAYREQACSRSLLRREGGFEEFEATVDFLLSSRYVTGRVLQLDGGRHLQGVA